MKRTFSWTYYFYLVWKNKEQQVTEQVTKPLANPAKPIKGINPMVIPGVKETPPHHRDESDDNGADWDDHRDK